MKTSPPDRADRLRALLSGRAKAAADRALDGGGIPPAELEELERLSRLLELSESAEPTVKKRWPLAAALAATLLVVSILLFMRLPATEVELDLTTSEVGFVVPTQQVLTESMNVSAVGIAGLSSIQLPRPFEVADSVPRSGDMAIRIAAASAGGRTGSVNLGALTVPPGTRVGVALLDGARRYRISLRGPNLMVRIGVLGPTETSVAGLPVTRVDFRTPRSIVVRSDSEEVFIDLTLPEGATAFSPLLPLTQLALFRVDRYPEGEQSVIRRVSAIQSGSVFLESLDGQERKLRTGQALEFDKIEGEIRTLRLDDDHITLQLHGRARGMTTGSGPTERSLMPTVLEWLYARHGASLLWGTTLYLFGLIAGILRWWKAGQS
jgi:hypothetical protein